MVLYNITSLLDTQGMCCPQPIIELRQALKAQEKGSLLLVMATDASFLLDCEVFVRQHNNVILNAWQQSGVFYVFLQK